MSRGSKTFYVSGLTDIGNQTTLNNEINVQVTLAQWGDIAIEKDTNAGALSTDAKTHRRANEYFQFDGANWIKILERTSADPTASTKTAYNQESIVSNVTNVRKAHTEDLRTFMTFVQQTYGKRYGENWHNIHNWTKAVMQWESQGGSARARMYMGNYSGNEHLTIEFGSSTSHLLKFVFRDDTMEAAGTYKNIMELQHEFVWIHQNAHVNKELNVIRDANFNEDVYVALKATAGTLVNRGQFFYLNPLLGDDEDSDITRAGNKARALARGTGNVLRINYAGDFEGGTLAQGHPFNHVRGTDATPASSFRIWTEEYDGHQTGNPDSLGIDACRIHGFHAEEGNRTLENLVTLNADGLFTDAAQYTIPVRGSAAEGGLIKGVIQRSLKADNAGSPSYMGRVVIIEAAAYQREKFYTIDCTNWADSWYTAFGADAGLLKADFWVYPFVSIYHTQTHHSGWGGVIHQANFHQWTGGVYYKPQVYVKNWRLGGYGTSRCGAEIMLIGAHKDTFIWSGGNVTSIT